MTNRTIQILGQGYSDSTASIIVTLAGVEIFSGNVSTLPLADIPSTPNLSIELNTVLTSFNVPVAYSGTQAMTCTVNSGVVIFAQIVANYQPVPNPIYSAEEWAILTTPGAPGKLAIYEAHAVPPLTPEEIALLQSTNPVDQPAKDAILASHGISLLVSGGSTVYADVDGVTDPRDNATLNGVAITPDRSEYQGTWWYTIEEGQTLGYNLTIIPGLE